MDEWNILSPEDKAQITRHKIVEMDEKIGQLQAYRHHLLEKLKRLDEGYKETST